MHSLALNLATSLPILRQRCGMVRSAALRKSARPKSIDPATDLARCFLRLANLPSYPLDRLSRYEATLWRQAGQILLAPDVVDRRKLQERGRRVHLGSRQRRPADECDDY